MLAIVFICKLTSDSIKKKRMKKSQELHQIEFMKAKLHAIATEIVLLENKIKIPLPKNMESLLKLLNDHAPDAIEEVIGHSSMRYDKVTFKRYDFWDKPIMLSITSLGGIELVSYGPNRKNDMGKYNDITYAVRKTK